MRLRNTTTFTDEEVRQAIRFARPHGISNFSICMTKSNIGSYGTYETLGKQVFVRIGKGSFPMRREGGGGYLPCLLLNRMELLVHLLAHELRHAWQSRHSKGKVWGARGRYSERDADAYAICKVRGWRKKQPIQLVEIAW